MHLALLENYNNNIDGKLCEGNNKANVIGDLVEIRKAISGSLRRN